KDYNYYKTKMLLAKKDSDEQGLLAEDQAWMDSISDLDQKINANMVFMAKMEKVLSDSDESSSSAEETIAEVAYYTSESQTSSLKPYVPTVILEKIIVDLEDEFVSILEKEKANLETIESLKSKDLDTFSSVRRLKHSGIIWKKKRSSNIFNVDLSFVSHSKLNKDVKRYSRKDLLSCNNSHIGEKSNAYDCNAAMTDSCNSRFYDSFDENNLFIFDDVNIFQICLWIIDLGCSKQMTGNRALLTNFVEKFFGTVRFSNNDFAVIAGYGDVVIGSLTIKKVYYVEGLGRNVFSVGQFCDKGLEVTFRKSTCFVRNEDGVDLLTGDRSSNLYTIALNEVASNSLACLLEKASSSQSWLWHQCLSHLNLATINNLGKKILFKLKEKRDIGVFVGYSKGSASFRIYNKLTQVLHESSKSFQEESSTSSLNDDVQQSLEEVEVPSSNIQSVSNNIVPNVDEASTSHNVFNGCLEDAYFDAIAQKKVKIAFENADLSSRVELIPLKIKCPNKVVLNFHKEFLVFSSFKGKENDRLLQNKVFKHKEEVVINNTIRIVPK
nr:integrase, catalytic region, zinc finger, CCHC-type, peptidase aspartic, catalytic [Tanacetum cinerariifolium]